MTRLNARTVMETKHGHSMTVLHIVSIAKKSGLAILKIKKMTKYIGFVESDAGITVEAESEEEAEEKLENIDTGHLGPPKVRSVEEF